MAKPADRPTPLVSIIIPTLNEEVCLASLLQSIQKQTVTAYEIIIADAGSTDATPSIAQRHGCTIVPGGMPGVGRNAGAKVAQAENLLFLDADVLLPETFLENMLSEFARKSLDIAIPKAAPRSDLHIDHLIFSLMNFSFYASQKISPILQGFCILCKRQLHNRIGGFDEKLRLAEDVEYVHRARKQGKYGICSSSYVLVSIRRWEREGRIKLCSKYVFSSIYMLINKNAPSKGLHYDLGHTAEVKGLTFLEQGIEKTLQMLSSLKKKLTKTLRK
jgi:glycosyltransferase involved in cell wall biosynthesis